MTAKAGDSDERPHVVIATDGACKGNPGPGGWGAVLRFGATEKDISGGEELTTNNRMEMMAAIVALETLAVLGYLPAMLAALLHTVASAFVIFNSARLVRFGENLESAPLSAGSSSQMEASSDHSAHAAVPAVA